MMQDLICMLLLGGCFLLLFGLAEWLHKSRKVAAEITRKIVHIGTGLLALLFPVYLHHTWQVAALCGSFLVLLVISKRRHFFSSINKIARVSYGSMLYPVSVFAVYCVYRYMQQGAYHFQPVYYYAAPLLLLAICDPAAAFFGHIYRRAYRIVRPGKTAAGSVGFFLTAFILLIFLQYSLSSSELLPVNILMNAAGCSLLTATTERVSANGWDNFTIPASCTIYLFLFEQVT